MAIFWKKDKAPSQQPTQQPSSPSAPQGQSAQSIQGIQGVRWIVAVGSGKGGVGKSTLATNLAVALKYLGYRVGLMDADIYGPTQPGLLGGTQDSVQTSPDGRLIPNQRFGVDFVSMGLLLDENAPVVWRAPMAMKMIHQFLANVQWGQLDYLLIDLPPGTGDVQLTLAQQASLTGAVIVSTPQDVALSVAKKGLLMFQQVKVPILGIVENMSGFQCQHCGKETAVFKQAGAEQMASISGVPFLGRIPLDPEIMLSGDEGIPVLARAKDSPAGQAYLQLAQQLDQQLQKTAGRLGAEEPTRVDRTAEGEVLISWPDGHQSLHKPFTLRAHCACAFCVEEQTGRKLLDTSKIPLNIQIKTVDQVGRYAISVGFSDGHNTGIYAFDRLRKICECPKCVKVKAPEQTFTV